MIYTALKLLRDELEAFVETRNKLDEEKIVLGNIAFLESSEENVLPKGIVITLVNIEEESALKNFKTYQRVNGSGTVENVNPSVHLNLYLLFSANYQGANEYNTALKRLSNIVQFFQTKNVFTYSNSAHAELDDRSYNPDLNDAQISELRLILDMYTLTFEQLNHLWGALGGKQIPSVLYKCRLVRISDAGLKRREPVIEEINSNDNLI